MLIHNIIKEFMHLVESLDNIPVEDNRLIISKERFRELLDQDPYLPFQKKVEKYKTLNYIIHDKNNYTLRCYDEALNKTIPKVALNYEAYLILARHTEHFND